jgi:hypothetical protein
MLAEHLTEVAIVVLAEVVSLVLLAVTVFAQFTPTWLPSFPLLPVTATVTIAHLPAVHM